MPSFPGTDADAYKALARAWAATVNVVTVHRHVVPEPDMVAEDLPGIDGFTATAFLTVSIAPPIILVSVTNASSAAGMLRDAKGFVVNLLAKDQADLSGAFARPQAERAQTLAGLSWTPDANGVPLLPGTAGAFSATPREFIEAGDHTLVLGDVTAIHHGATLETLLYHNRAYGAFQANS
jgi:flavin reductase (DIM6/NTAB) family NADH-FMN oxidoreductase RutF